MPIDKSNKLEISLQYFEPYDFVFEQYYEPYTVFQFGIPELKFSNFKL